MLWYIFLHQFFSGVLLFFIVRRKLFSSTCYCYRHLKIRRCNAFFELEIYIRASFCGFLKRRYFWMPTTCMHVVDWWSWSFSKSIQFKAAEWFCTKPINSLKNDSPNIALHLYLHARRLAYYSISKWDPSFRYSSTFYGAKRKKKNFSSSSYWHRHLQKFI